MSKTAILTTLVVAVITLVIGVSIGSIAYPITRTETISTLSTQTLTLSPSIYTVTLSPSTPVYSQTETQTVVLLSTTTLSTTTTTSAINGGHSSQSITTMSQGQAPITTVLGSGTTEVCVNPSQPTVRLRIVNDTGSPMPSIVVNGFVVDKCNGILEVFPLSSQTTNSSGWVSWAGIATYYHLWFKAYTWDFNITIPTQPYTTSIATYVVPDGNLSIGYCCAP